MCQVEGPGGRGGWCPAAVPWPGWQGVAGAVHLLVTQGLHGCFLKTDVLLFLLEVKIGMNLSLQGTGITVSHIGSSLGGGKVC